MEAETILVFQEVSRILDELADDFQRRQDQAILQQDLYKANYALAGKETCREVKRRVETRLQMHENMVREISARKRA